MLETFSHNASDTHVKKAKDSYTIEGSRVIRAKGSDVDSIYLENEDIDIMEEDEEFETEFLEIDCPWDQTWQCVIPECIHNKPVLILIHGSGEEDNLSRHSSVSSFMSDMESLNGPEPTRKKIVAELQSIGIQTLYLDSLGEDQQDTFKQKIRAFISTAETVAHFNSTVQLKEEGALRDLWQLLHYDPAQKTIANNSDSSLSINQ